MGKRRKGYIRERQRTFIACVVFIDEKGSKQKIERPADTQKQAKQGITAIKHELAARTGVSTFAERIKEKRGGIFARVTYTDDNGKRCEVERRLQWADVDFAESVINIRAFNTKTMRERQVAMSERLAQELLFLFEKSSRDLDSLCFGITTGVKTAFSKARQAAGLLDVRFHDLRHTHATRLVGAHMPLSEVGRVLGHTQANTTFRYVNANVETSRRAARLIDEFNKSVDDDGKPVIN